MKHYLLLEVSGFLRLCQLYDLCTERINLVADDISKNGKLYNDFESAIDYYRMSGTVSGESSDIKEFNSIMEFLYLGRKSKNELN